MSRRLLREDGIALVMALGIRVVLIIFVASMISYTSANARSAQLSSADLTARQYADAGLNTAYSILQNQTVVSGGNPAAANLLGCNGAGGATALPSRALDWLRHYTRGVSLLLAAGDVVVYGKRRV
jgi:Tfp pilus assembly protein PilX